MAPSVSSMLNKILLFIMLGVFAGLAPADAQTAAAPAAAARVKGRITAARVQGHVEAITKADGQTRVLHDGDALTEKTQVVTAPGGNVTLVFSNGAVVNVAAGTTLDIEQFDQDPFANDLKVSEMTAESGTSTTRLNLTRGELVGKVVHLNVDKGSEFTVQTPVGAAGIRGTTFRIVFTPSSDGKAFFTVTTAEGRVLFTGTTSGPVSIPAGKQVVATFDYTPPAPGSTTPAAPATTPVTIVTTDTPPAEAAQIQAVSQAIVTTTQNLTIQSNTTTNNPPPSTPSPAPPSNPPPPPVVPPPPTTPGAGNGG